MPHCDRVQFVQTLGRIKVSTRLDRHYLNTPIDPDWSLWQDSPKAWFKAYFARQAFNWLDRAGRFKQIERETIEYHTVTFDKQMILKQISERLCEMIRTGYEPRLVYIGPDIYHELIYAIAKFEMVYPFKTAHYDDWAESGLLSLVRELKYRVELKPLEIVAVPYMEGFLIV